MTTWPIYVHLTLYIYMYVFICTGGFSKQASATDMALPTDLSGILSIIQTSGIKAVLTFYTFSYLILQ